METTAITALKLELEQAEHALKEQKAADAQTIADGERAAQRVRDRTRTRDEIAEAIKTLESVQRGKQIPVDHA